MPTIISDAVSTTKKIYTLTSNWDNVHIVADFDATLTQYVDYNGKTRPSLMSILRDEKILGPKYTDQANLLYKKYSTIEHDQKIPLTDRCVSNQERRNKHKKVLMKYRLHKNHIDEIVRVNKIVMRPGTDIFIRYCHKNNIPFVIFSASGIGVNTIHKQLQQRGLYLPNIDIVSNEIYRDNDGYMSGYSMPIIHSLNKYESVIRDSDTYKKLQEKLKTRYNAIILGDSIGDANMVEDKDECTVLRIGLCNHSTQDRLVDFEKHFDIVITDDDGLQEVVQYITNKKGGILDNTK